MKSNLHFVPSTSCLLLDIKAVKSDLDDISCGHLDLEVTGEVIAVATAVFKTWSLELAAGAL